MGELDRSIDRKPQEIHEVVMNPMSASRLLALYPNPSATRQSVKDVYLTNRFVRYMDATTTPLLDLFTEFLFR